MNEKWYNDIEQKIKEAAAQTHHKFEEADWQKMEQLLDGRRKRRPVWMWLLPIMILAGAGVAWFAISEFTNKGAEEVSDPGEKVVAVNHNDQAVKNGQGTPASKQNIADTSTTVAFDSLATSSQKNGNSFQKPIPIYSEKTFYQRKANDFTLLQSDLEDRLINIKFLTTETGTILLKDRMSLSMPGFEQKDLPTNFLSNKKIDVPKKNAGRGFYLLASAGPEMNSVKPLDFGNATAGVQFGFGVGYKVNNRLSVQTGVYYSNKKYAAKKGDYYYSPDSYWAEVDLHDIDAACKIYEIPVSVRYNFNPQRKTKFYAGAGVSSFIMKKEDYEYYYTKNGEEHKSNYDYTGNKHLFSHTTIFAGAERTLSKRLSVIAQPTFAIPISGVGEGKVKLNSASLQLGLKMNLGKHAE